MSTFPYISTPRNTRQPRRRFVSSLFNDKSTRSRRTAGRFRKILARVVASFESCACACPRRSLIYHAIAVVHRSSWCVYIRRYRAAKQQVRERRAGGGGTRNDERRGEREVSKEREKEKHRDWKSRIARRSRAGFSITIARLHLPAADLAPLFP